MEKKLWLLSLSKTKSVHQWPPKTWYFKRIKLSPTLAQSKSRIAPMQFIDFREREVPNRCAVALLPSFLARCFSNRTERQLARASISATRESLPALTTLLCILASMPNRAGFLQMISIAIQKASTTL